MTEIMNLFGELVKIGVEKPVPASLPTSPNACSICLTRAMPKWLHQLAALILLPTLCRYSSDDVIRLSLLLFLQLFLLL